MTNIDYLLQIIRADLAIGYVVDSLGQTASNENYWVRITYGRCREIVDFPDVAVEDRDTRKIVYLTREAVRDLQRRV